MVLESYYGVLTGLFSPVLSLNIVLAEFILASMLVLIITLIYKLLGNQNKAKEIKTQISEMQKKMKEIKENKEETDRLATEMLKLTNQQMRSSFKPMIVVLIIAFVFLPWMSDVFVNSVVSLPFSLPFFGNDFGWLAWYIVVSLPLSMIFRKALGVVT